MSVKLLLKMGKVKQTNEAEYLGCIITDNGKPYKELNKRKADDT